MVLLLNLSHLGRLDSIRGGATVRAFMPRRINSFTEQPSSAALVLSWQ